MKALITAYLQENIGESIEINDFEHSNKFPIFLKEIYRFFATEILGRSCLLLEIQDEEPGIDKMKKHIKLINNIVDDEVVFVYKSISRFRKKSLIQNYIAFVVQDKQMFLPFLGLDIKDVIDKPKEELKRFSDSAQLIFLYFLYHKELKINGTELAGILNVTVMTASRILNELYRANLLTYEIGGKTGKSKEYSRIGNPDYYEKGSKYLKNPIKKIVYVDQVMGDYSVAGVEAISMISMINPPDKKVRAIYKNDFDTIAEQVILDEAQIIDEKLDEVQIWRYDPVFLAENKIVDVVSLSLSLRELKDERIDQALEKLMETEEWYMG